MKTVSGILIGVAIVLAILTYQQHDRCKQMDRQRFSLNLNDAMSIEVAGPGAQKADNAERTRNMLGAAAAACAVLGIAGLALCSRQRD